VKKGKLSQNIYLSGCKGSYNLLASGNKRKEFFAGKLTYKSSNKKSAETNTVVKSDTEPNLYLLCEIIFPHEQRSSH
jgi:hypothetical protein